MRIIKALVWIVVILLVVVGISVMFFGGTMIKHGVEMVGPEVLGVSVTLEHARLSPLRGEAHLRGLRVGNPEGFETESLFDLGEMDVHLNLRSLLTDTIVIRQINILDPVITYEQALRRNNIGTLLGNLETRTEEVPPEEEPGKNVVIEELIIEGARVNASFTAMGGQTVSVNLPRIEMQDLGKEEEPLTFAEAIREILAVIAASTGQAVSGAADLVGEGAKAARDAARGLKEGAEEGIRGLFGRDDDEDEEEKEEGEGIRGLLGRDRDKDEKKDENDKKEKGLRGLFER